MRKVDELMLKCLDGFFMNYHRDGNFDEVSFRITSGGVRGGNCWGDSRCNFTVDEEDLKKELCGDFKSYLFNFLSFLSKYDMNEFTRLVDEWVGSTISNYEIDEDDSDYYGNYNIKKVFKFSLADVKGVLLKIADAKEVDELFCVFEEKARKVSLELKERQELSRISLLEVEVEEFNGKKKNERVALERTIAIKKKDLAELEGKLENFEKVAQKELKSLVGELESLRSKFSEYSQTDGKDSSQKKKKL